MAGAYFISDLRARATFAPDKLTKLDCFRSDRLFAGLNCLVRGQSQSTHAHDSMDKFYLVLSGKARIVVGEEKQELSTGGMAWAPAGVAHGIDVALEDSVILVTMSPPPRGEEGRGKSKTSRG
jgi:quercetin dioxygenase-like cupin family protein